MEKERLEVMTSPPAPDATRDRHGIFSGPRAEKRLRKVPHSDERNLAHEDAKPDFLAGFIGKSSGTASALVPGSGLSAQKNWVKDGIMSELKKMLIGVFVTILFIAGLLISVAAQAEVQASDPAAFYKAKCLACHGQKAEKKFDSTLPDEQLIDIVMKGKKVEKPPHMPAYSDKGVSSDQAKALVEYMKQLKSAQ